MHGANLKTQLKHELSRVLEENTRSHDYLGAMGDGAYLLVLPHTSGENGDLVAQRIRTSFGALGLVADGKPLPLTMSLGLATCEDRETMFFDTLVSQAEVALEWAMREGGDRVVLFEREKFVGRD